MNFSHRLLLLVPFALVSSLGRLQAQDTTAVDTDAAPPAGTTIITSDELRMDQSTHIAVFTGNVVVVGTNFNMKCQEMTVNFTKDNKVDTILAKGDVVIVQPDRTTHSGVAEYSKDDDKFDLTDSPTIVDSKKNKISAPEIIIYRTKGSMYTKGRTRTELSQDSGPGLGTAPASDDSTNK
jgi:lipopolysaccharide transport protein LptA